MNTVTGLAQIKDCKKLLAGKSVGLITNFSGVTDDWKYDNVAFFKECGYHITRIFTPEHGLYGAGAGEYIDEESQQKGGRPHVVSLYGDKKKPVPEDLRDIDILVFDMQDAGLRYYTYLYTMTYAMEAAAEAGIPFAVLDRPNPLGGRIVAGERILPSIHSFVGDYELPMRHSLTLGEAAGYFKEYAGLHLDLEVVRMKNYTRKMFYPQTGLFWNIPSPALPAFESVLCYSGGCLFEACNISEGRGSMKPFQIYGAPFIDMDFIYQELYKRKVGEDFAFRRRAFIPVSGKYAGEVCYGLEFYPLSVEGDFLPTALALLKIICERYEDKVVFRKEKEGEDGVHLRTLYGNDMAENYLHGKISLEDLKERWREEAEAFLRKTEAFRLYEKG